jgi:microcystin-dependent protein
MAVNTIAPAGSSFPHNNMQPYLTLYFNIALQGIFPPRS